jgi:hypothetical protein
LAAVLDAASAAILDFDLELYVEIFALVATVCDVAVADRLLLCGFADDGAVLDTPNGGIAIPILEGGSVEDLNVAGMVVEVDRVGLAEAG